MVSAAAPSAPCRSLLFSPTSPSPTPGPMWTSSGRCAGLPQRLQVHVVVGDHVASPPFGQEPAHAETVPAGHQRWPHGHAQVRAGRPWQADRNSQVLPREPVLLQRGAGLLGERGRQRYGRRHSAPTYMMMETTVYTREFSFVGQNNAAHAISRRSPSPGTRPNTCSAWARVRCSTARSGQRARRLPPALARVADIRARGGRALPEPPWAAA